MYYCLWVYGPQGARVGFVRRHEFWSPALWLRLFFFVFVRAGISQLTENVRWLQRLNSSESFIANRGKKKKNIKGGKTGLVEKKNTPDRKKTPQGIIVSVTRYIYFFFLDF